MIETTQFEMWSWTFTILMFFIPPILIYLFIKIVLPCYEFKKTLSFYLGWIPGNIVACGYLAHVTGSILDFVVLFISCQVFQFFFVIVLAKLFMNWVDH
jgi:hypothetical protein